MINNIDRKRLINAFQLAKNTLEILDPGSKIDPQTAHAIQEIDDVIAEIQTKEPEPEKTDHRKRLGDCGYGIGSAGPDWEPHDSHIMDEWSSTIASFSGTPRFYGVRECKNCEGEEYRHTAGHFADWELDEPCWYKDEKEEVS